MILESIPKSKWILLMVVILRQNMFSHKLTLGKNKNSCRSYVPQHLDYSCRTPPSDYLALYVVLDIHSTRFP